MYRLPSSEALNVSSTNDSVNAPIDDSDATSTDASDSDDDNPGNQVSELDTPELIPQMLSQTMPDGVTIQVSGNLPVGIITKHKKRSK